MLQKQRGPVPRQMLRNQQGEQSFHSWRALQQRSIAKLDHQRLHVVVGGIVERFSALAGAACGHVVADFFEECAAIKASIETFSGLELGVCSGGNALQSQRASEWMHQVSSQSQALRGSSEVGVSDHTVPDSRPARSWYLRCS